MEETFVRELPKFLIILTAAIIAGEIFVRFGQSQSLGYLTAGILLGPALFNFFPQEDSVISFFATLWLAFLLFEVGLETDFSKLKKEGLRALTVAVIRVSLPLLFGWLSHLSLVWRFASWLIKWVHRMKSSGFLETSVFLLCLVVAWIASEIGLALIVGAFIAGLMLESVEEREHVLVRMDFLKNAFLPLFFVSAGALFNPLAIGNVESAILLAFISAIAVTGKVVSGFGARGLCLRSMILIGSGMIPRGEVGLIFAASGRLVGVFDERMYGVALGMIMVTTFIAPIVLKPLAEKR